jgi:hypothetical protein
MRKIYYTLLALALLSFYSCGSSMKYYMINADMTRVSLGMTKEQVYEKIGKPNTIISAQRLPEGDLEVLEYMRLEHNSYTEKSAQRPIWTYFLNNELIEWGPGEDWQIDHAINNRILEKHKNRNRE